MWRAFLLGTKDKNSSVCRFVNNTICDRLNLTDLINRFITNDYIVDLIKQKKTLEVIELHKQNYRLPDDVIELVIHSDNLALFKYVIQFEHEKKDITKLAALLNSLDILIYAMKNGYPFHRHCVWFAIQNENTDMQNYLRPYEYAMLI